MLEDAKIKPGSVVRDVSGETGMSIAEALIAGVTDTGYLSELAR
jgi:hypothetical protein